MNSKIHLGRSKQENQNNQHNIGEQSQGVILPNFKTHYKSMLIKTVMKEGTNNVLTDCCCADQYYRKDVRKRSTQPTNLMVRKKQKHPTEKA